ncbi:hypothetical protein KUTeg_011647 [Tegillarca granosa]|uniref:Uncharacterized protein n=1 Tax=Tegillarca granosa TaxID=220873 RepID=A0ABQ9F0K4_TEGGR|nr:hypothetical protein KUTeg_011647 [Tegillarca granosa]
MNLKDSVTSLRQQYSSARIVLNRDRGRRGARTRGGHNRPKTKRAMYLRWGAESESDSELSEELLSENEESLIKSLRTNEDNKTEGSDLIDDVVNNSKSSKYDLVNISGLTGILENLEVYQDLDLLLSPVYQIDTPWLTDVIGDVLHVGDDHQPSTKEDTTPSTTGNHQALGKDDHQPAAKDDTLLSATGDHQPVAKDDHQSSVEDDTLSST